MSPKLASLVMAVGGIAAAGILAVLYVPKPGVQLADLLDAGIQADCSRRDLKVQLSGDDCADGGYCRKKIDVAVCNEPDGGKSVIVPRRFARVVADSLWTGQPGPSTLPSDGDADIAFDCACARTDAGACLQTSDGGPALVGVTLGAGAWSGAGCVPKPCVEWFGRSSWPGECPLQ